MPVHQLLKRFPDNTWLAYDEGRFDNWRVSYWKEGCYLWSPSDFEMFTGLSELAKKHGWWRVWRIIRHIAKQINPSTKFLDVNIELLEESVEESKLFHALAAMMIAEENKNGTMLGKNIKLVGCYQVLAWGWLPFKAANWSRGKPWKQIREEYKFLMM